MVNETLVNGTSVVSEVSMLVSQRFEWIYNILKGVGVVLLLYLIYFGYNAYINQKSRHRIKKIENILLEVNEKLDSIIVEKKKKIATLQEFPKSNQKDRKFIK